MFETLLCHPTPTMANDELSKKDKVLFVLPLPEPPNLAQRIQDKHPDVEVEFIYHQFDAKAALNAVQDPVPRGMSIPLLQILRPPQLSACETRL